MNCPKCRAGLLHSARDCAESPAYGYRPPVMSAHELARQIAFNLPLPPESYLYGLLAAAREREGNRYAEAIRGANEARTRIWWMGGKLSGVPSYVGERAFGCPIGFRTILDNRETPRMAFESPDQANARRKGLCGAQMANRNRSGQHCELLAEHQGKHASQCTAAAQRVRLALPR